MRIQHNLNAMNSLRQLGTNNNATGKNLEKLSSGYKINRAGDNAAGLAISEKMRGQIRGLEQAQNNANDGISLIQTAEGGLNETHAILQRMREIAVQSSNGTYQNAVDRENLNKEVTALKTEIDRISTSTQFNKISLLDGSLGSAAQENTVSGTVGEFSGTDVKASGVANVTTLDFAGKTGEDVIGATIKVSGVTYEFATASGTLSDSNNIRVTVTDTTAASGIASAFSTAASATGYTDAPSGAVVKFTESKISGIYKGTAAPTISQTAKGLTFQIGANGVSDQQVSLQVENMGVGGLGISGINVLNQDTANAAIDKLDTAINTVSATRADLGALQNRLEHTVNNLGVTSENLTAAESRIRDVDMAKEMMEYTKNNILSQAAQAMLAQANQQPQGVLQLLQ
jgi:flagellin